jgi:hypothetical protein
MKSIIRLTALLALALTALFPAMTVAVNAQATPCYGLADADCKLLQDATGTEATAKLSSFVLDYTLKATIAGTGKFDGTLNITGSGPLAIDPAVVADLKANAGKQMDPAAMMKAVSALTFGNTIKLDSTLPNVTPGSFEVRIVGGNLYFMGDKATQGKWMVLNLAQSMQGMAGSMMGMSPSTSSTNPVMDPKVQADLQALAKVPGVVKTEATDGPSIDGQATRKLAYNLDLAAMLAAPEFKTLMTDASATSGQTMDTAQLDQTVQMGQAILKDTKFQVSYLVGSSDKLFHGFGLTLAVKLDPTYAALLTNNSDAKELNVNFDLNVQLSKIGQPVKVDPVADAQNVNPGGMMATPAK